MATAYERHKLIIEEARRLVAENKGLREVNRKLVEATKQIKKEPIKLRH